jgi:nucleotide-binding universal stress UspA family protein
MLETIVTAISDLKEAEQVIAHAAKLALPFSSRVIVVSIIKQMDGRTDEKFTDPVLWSMAKSEAQAILNQYVQQLQEQGIKAELEFIEASTAEALLQYAEDLHGDLIVVAYNHETPAPIIRSILKHSKTPVFLARGEEPKSTYSNILVPLDGSQRAESILSLTATIANSMNAKLHLAHIVQQPEMMGQTGNSTEVSEMAQRLVEKTFDEAKRYLEQVASRLPIEVKTHVITDSKVTRSLHDLVVGEQIDLLMLSAHGYSGEPQWPFGSIAENIINYSNISTILVQDLPAHFSTHQSEPPTRLQTGTHKLASEMN